MKKIYALFLTIFYVYFIHDLSAQVIVNPENIGINVTSPDGSLDVGGDVFVRTNLGALRLGYPDNGNQWRLSTIGGGQDLLFRSKPASSGTLTTRFQMYQSGEFGIGLTSTPEGWLHILSNSTLIKPQIMLEESDGNDFARIGFKNSVNNAEWHVAATAFEGVSGASLSRMNFWFTNDQGGADRMTIMGDGRVGIGNTSPDEDLVIGTNLGGLWTIPAATVGSSDGGVMQLGSSIVNLSLVGLPTLNRSQIYAKDANGLGQGIIEMSTRQLNVGRFPGVNTTRVYPLRVKQNITGQGGNYGIDLINGDTSNDWELFVSDNSNGNNLILYYNTSIRGSFNSTSGNYTPLSDERAKKNIQKMDKVLDKLNALKPSSYNYISDESKQFNGFLAQDVAKVFPEIAVQTKRRNDEKEDLYLVDYSQLTVVAIKAIQEQNEYIKILEEKINKLSTLVESLSTK